jgi:hypothetical protein
MNKRSDKKAVAAKAATVEWQPAYEGAIEFDITIDVLGLRSTRRARVEYGLTPPWEHCGADGRLRNPTPGGLVGFNVKLRNVGMRQLSDGSLRHVEMDIGWEPSSVFEEGHLDEEVWHAVDKMIEERCQLEDAIRREMHKLPPCDYPPFERGVASVLDYSTEDDADQN